MEPLTLHVATGGDDAGPGTEEAPFATIERARDEVAERLLDGAVSGAADTPVVFAAAPGERVVLSGGVPVTGWQREGDSGDLWAASTPTGEMFRTLRVRDRLAERTLSLGRPGRPHPGRLAVR